MARLTEEDFECTNEPPRSIREMVAESLSYTTYYKDGERHVRPEQEPLDVLMEKVYWRIEKGAIERYKSNRLWAIRAWCYDNLLADSVAKEAAVTDESLLDELVQPVATYLDRDFDPVSYIERTMGKSKARRYVVCCCRIAEDLVTRYGKKRRYTDEELLDYKDHLEEQFKASSFAIMCNRLKAVLKRLPEDEDGRKQHIPTFLLDDMPKVPPAGSKEYDTPTFSKNELEKQAIAALLDEPPDVILRLLVSQVYGVRLSELADIQAEYINLDHDKPGITFLIRKKRGTEREPITQPIPEQLIPFFSIPIQQRNVDKLRRDLRRICRKAGVSMPRRSGYHSIRRQVTTMLEEMTGLKDIDVSNYMRWSVSSFGMLGRYAKVDTYARDLLVLDQHPMVDFWKDFADCWEWAPGYEGTLPVFYNKCVHQSKEKRF